MPPHHFAHRLAENIDIQTAAELELQRLVISHGRISAHLRGEPDLSLSFRGPEFIFQSACRRMVERFAVCQRQYRLLFPRGRCIRNVRLACRRARRRWNEFRRLHLRQAFAESRHQPRQVGIGVRGSHDKRAIFPDVNPALAQQVEKQSRKFLLGRKTELNQRAETASDDTARQIHQWIACICCARAAVRSASRCLQFGTVFFQVS